MLDGQWKFTDAQVASFTQQLFNEYREIFGGAPSDEIDIFILPFPQNVGFGEWEADTRGSTVTIVSSDAAFDTHSVQRLHEQLRHELFHLWIPNGITLTGKYDWFYEGFALYQSLKTGVALNRLRFDDFLDTLGRAMTIDAMLPAGRSLIDASASRAGAADTAVYARGMLAAFLTDVELMTRSNGSQDVTSVLRTIFQRYRKDRQLAADGNSAVLETINSNMVTRFVRGGEKVDWARELAPAGILMSKDNNLTLLKAAPRPSSKQKKMLDKLGYNNWRKLSAVPR
jgi:predicted metalloprotease with PDZ domain